MDQQSANRGRSEIDALAARLYAEERTRLLAIARQNSDHEDDAEEALSEAFVLFLAKFESGSVSRAGLLADHHPEAGLLGDGEAEHEGANGVRPGAGAKGRGWRRSSRAGGGPRGGRRGARGDGRAEAPGAAGDRPARPRLQLPGDPRTDRMDPHEGQSLLGRRTGSAQGARARDLQVPVRLSVSAGLGDTATLLVERRRLAAGARRSAPVSAAGRPAGWRRREPPGPPRGSPGAPARASREWWGRPRPGRATLPSPAGRRTG